MPDSFKSLGDVFRKEPAFKYLREVVKSSDVVNDFYKIFPDFEKIALPLKVDKKVLKLRVENPTWRSEMKFRESEIVERINKFYNEERIKQIRFSS
ncbi:MAG: hypothetical protein DRQ13_04775 [Ignavibacteriae bacterium]|nr:MAG: hypothetical protein DRQ13_04775 [Ignavibacteriota bacterium]